MDPTTLVSVHEYLHTDYSPDCDYVDGVLEDRNVGTSKHSIVQMEVVLLSCAVSANGSDSSFVRTTNSDLGDAFQSPDVCVLLAADPEEDIVTTAPFLCVEVVSPDDRSSRLQEKVRDYLNIGVRFVWVIDPNSRTAWTYTPRVRSKQRTAC